MTPAEYLKSSLHELDGDIVNHWYILALQNEVPLAKPLARTVYDRPYVLFRDEQGKIKVYLDQCIHRGAPLSEGHCEKGGIRCPYHGWRYDSDGHMAEIPSEGPEVLESGRRKWQLNGIPTFIKDGCVWIWPGDKNLVTASPEWDFPKYSDPKWVTYFMVTDFDNEVGHLVQNFMDVPHTVYVHDKWFRKKKTVKVKVGIEVKNSRVKVTYNNPNDKIGFIDSFLNPKKEPMVHTDEFIFPNITRVDYTFGDRGFIINSQCTPITRFKTRVYTWMAYDIGFLSKSVKPFIQFYTRKVISQDVEIMNQHGSVLKSLGENTYHSSGADELHLAIQKMRELGARDRQAPCNMSFTKEKEFWI